jgi:hypothetical protein
MVDRMAKATAHFSAVVPPAVSDRDLRHTGEGGLQKRFPSAHYDLRKYAFKYKSRIAPIIMSSDGFKRPLDAISKHMGELNKLGPLQDTKELVEYEESMGTWHLMESWMQQGHLGAQVS